MSKDIPLQRNHFQIIIYSASLYLTSNKIKFLNSKRAKTHAKQISTKKKLKEQKN